MTGDDERDGNDRWTSNMAATLLLAKASLLSTTVIGAWISGWSGALDEPIRAVLGLLLALGAAVALYRLVDVRVHR
jgi:hypothetical protein